MSTDFTLYALDEAQVPLARRYMAGSLGYGNTDLASIIDAAARAQRGIEAGDLSGFDVFHSPSFVIDDDHTSTHDSSSPWKADHLDEVVGHDLPVLDNALARRIMDTVGTDWAAGTVWPEDKPKADGKWDYRRAKPYEFRIGLRAWLDGARGRRLWYCFV